MGKKGPLWWRESDWLLRGSSAANQILLRHSGPILSIIFLSFKLQFVLRSRELRTKCPSFCCVTYILPKSCSLNFISGINIFLDGYISTENLRFRETALTFRVAEKADDREARRACRYEYQNMTKSFGKNF